MAIAVYNHTPKHTVFDPALHPPAIAVSVTIAKQFMARFFQREQPLTSHCCHTLLAVAVVVRGQKTVPCSQ